jgi:hypothetical protein
VGFAWDPFHNGKTALRGSFGVFDILPMGYQYIAAATKQFPFVASGAVNHPAQGTFYKGLEIQPPTGDGGTLRRSALRYPWPHRSYVMQWNLNIQRELVGNLTAMPLPVEDLRWRRKCPHGRRRLTTAGVLTSTTTQAERFSSR